MACSRGWKDFLVNRGRSQVFSTALPVPVVAAALAALRVAAEVRLGLGCSSSSVHLRCHEVLVPATLIGVLACPAVCCPQEPWRREHVWQLARRLGSELGVPVSSPIVPLVIGPEREAVDASMQLLRAGFHVPAIRPPTVPPGTSRLRVSLSAAHTEDDLQQLIDGLRECGVRFQQSTAKQGAAAAGAAVPAAQPGEGGGDPAPWMPPLPPPNLSRL